LLLNGLIFNQFAAKDTFNSYEGFAPSFQHLSYEDAVVVESRPCTATLQNQQTEVGEGICCWSLDYGKAI